MAVQFNGKSYPLKYLFTAELADGTIYKQTKEDKSKGEKEGSAFTDIADKDIKTFTLKRFGESHSVNLVNGEFTINGKTFSCHDEPLREFRLVFYRRHYHDSNSKGQEIAHRVEYHFGWQTTFNGKNIKRIIILK
jgi:hypothetical protein